MEQDKNTIDTLKQDLQSVQEKVGRLERELESLRNDLDQRMRRLEGREGGRF